MRSDAHAAAGREVAMVYSRPFRAPARRQGRGGGLQGSELARQIADTLADLQAEAIVLLDISGIAGFTDYFVIASAVSPRQFEALAEAITREAPRAGAQRPRREGTPAAGWLLLDFGDVIVHLFTPEERAYYELEQLWGRGKQLLRIE